MRGKRIVLDEVHRLVDPAQILKIAADHFPTTRIVATGSSTLGASARFRDTLAGRKAELWLTPMCEADVRHERGLEDGREDQGLLFEHYVLNEIHAHLGRVEVRYWRSKSGNEVDFVFAPRSKAPTAIECRWSADAFDPANLKAFRRRYPAGRNLVVAADVDREFERRYGDLGVRFVGLAGLVRILGGAPPPHPGGA